MTTQKPRSFMKSISKIIWSEEAIKNLKAIVKYLQLKWTDQEINKFARRLEKQIEIIKNQPRAYPISKKKNIRKAVMTHQVTFYYEISNDAVKIISLFDTRQNPAKLKI